MASAAQLSRAAGRAAPSHGSGQLPQTQVADGQRTGVIALDTDQSGGGTPILRIGRKFAGRHPAGPVRALQFVVHDLLPVEPVLDVRALDHETRLVPLTERPYDARRRGIEGVSG